MGWSKAELIKDMEELNKEFETKGFNQYAKLIAKASTPEEIQKIVDRIKLETGVIISELIHQDGGPDAPNLEELTKQQEKEQAEKEKLAKEQAEKEGKGKPSENPAVDTSNVKDMPKGENKPASVSKSLPDTGFDGGIVTVGLIAGLVGLTAKRFKTEE